VTGLSHPSLAADTHQGWPLVDVLQHSLECWQKDRGRCNPRMVLAQGTG
jgi:hypothetical protein